MQRARGERRRRIFLAIAPLQLRDDERHRPHRVDDRASVGLGLQLGLVPIDLGERRLERLVVLGAQRLDGPVLLRLEGADIALTFHEQAQRHRLHPSRRQAGLDRSPKDRTRFVADETVEDTPGLLRVDLAFVDGARYTHGFEHGVAGDLFKEYPVRRHCRIELIGDVPSDRFALTVRVGREIDRAGRLGRLLQLGKGFRLSFNGDVLGLEPMLDVHAKLARGEVADVPDRCPDIVTGPEIFPDRLGLGRRLDHDQRRALARHFGFGLGRILHSFDRFNLSRLHNLRYLRCFGIGRARRLRLTLWLYGLGAFRGLSRFFRSCRHISSTDGLGHSRVKRELQETRTAWDAQGMTI